MNLQKLTIAILFVLLSTSNVFAQHNSEVRITVDPINSGTTTGEGTYITGSSVDITAFPNVGHNFNNYDRAWLHHASFCY